MTFALCINGQTRHVDAPPDQPPLRALREQLCFKGAKHGSGSCARAACTPQVASSTPWRLGMFGGCTLVAPDGGPVSLSTRKSLALLAYLARQPAQRAPRERLAMLLWEDATPGQARLNLRKTLSSLRHEARACSPGTALIEADNDAAWLVAGAVRTDVEAFEAIRGADLTDPMIGSQVADLYTGDFLADFSIRNASAFETWALVERQRLREQAIHVLSRLTEAALELGLGPEVAAGAAARVLALDPLQEGAHRAIMRLHVRQGRRAAALRQFHALSELLARELNTTPEAETRALFREISSSRHRALPAPAALPRAPEALSAPDSPAPTVMPRPRRRGLVLAAAAAVGFVVAVTCNRSPSRRTLPSTP